MSLSRPSMAYDPNAPKQSFFEKERERLVEEISAGFEELLTHSNVLNRTLEEVHGVGKEFTTVAKLWGRFDDLIRQQQAEQAGSADIGVPGTGGANYGASTMRQG
ncbi:DASH complex subunit Dad1-domain-containing protein [Dioszegia hungarica]|uniref:DASH complex subunit DAD1 n=1 Tax=Dioszegia hungarica TaxID=4972 RepID=A0AA38HBT7_9TREE|nr:DASH complex subunit Dad1-domain-containing protein [Dioszegia hungarica]KAI9637252.1 DASH complex subunit Dad1-domain-containing protein [Dioszegia hungarica]